MSDEDTRTIALSRTKMVWTIVGCLLFVALGLWLLTVDEAFIESQRRFSNPLFVRAVGIVALVFFGSLLVVMIRKIFDARPGLVLNSAGLLDNSSGAPVGFIPWSDIAGLGVYRSFNHRMLVVKLDDPGKYFGDTLLTRYLRKSSHKMCGSPVSINAGTLKMGFDELSAVVHLYLSRFGRTA